MNIVFGLHLDGLTYPETVTSETFDVGGIVAGPAGLGQQLALRLGLQAPFTPQAVRIGRYMRAMEECDDEQQWYSKSFQLDAWSTASCLLVMRDQLINAGWDGKGFADSNLKLQSLAMVEQIAFPLGSPSETLRSVLFTLREKRDNKLPIKSIVLKTPCSLLPVVWQEIIAELQSAGVKIEERNDNFRARDNTDLAKVQQFLTTGKSSTLVKDGSFTLLEADDEYQLAEVTTGWLSAQCNELDDLVVIRDSPTTILDAFCSQNNLPRFGGYDKSRWRSALQVLPLMLECCWLPANPRSTLELMSLPEGPIPRTLSYHFVRALRQEPGFGGRLWAEAWKNAESSLTDAARNTEDASLDSESIREQIDNLRFWLEPERYDPKIGMPSEAIIAICRKVRRWAAASMRQNGASEMFVQAFNATEELEAAINSTGLAHFSRVQLARLIDAVAGEGCRPERWHAEAAPWAIVDHPGQIWSAAKRVLWWGFSLKPIIKSHFDPWTEAEVRLLAESGIHVERLTTTAIREAYAWRQAILNSTDQILFCRTRVSRGQETLIHPLWHEIEPLSSESGNLVIVQAHKMTSVSTYRLGEQQIRLRRLRETETPSAYRDWPIPENKVLQRPQESFSSMHELFGCPMAWSLKNYAKLYPGALLDVPDGDSLIGTIAHKVFLQLFCDRDLQNLYIRAEQIFDEVVQAIGLPMLQPGRSVERSYARRSIAQAAEQFGKLLESSQLTIAECESRKERAFRDGTFHGDVDLLLKDKNDHPIVVDYKWNKNLKYRMAEIEENRHLQLAAYAWLESAASGEFAHVGYYMLRQQRLIHCGNAAVTVGQQVSGASLEDVWHRAETEYELAVSRLSSGIMTAVAISPVDESTAEVTGSFVKEPPCKFCDFGTICGQRGTDDA